MSWFRRKSSAPPVAPCLHSWKLTDVFTHYWDNGFDTSSEIYYELTCTKCLHSKNKDEYDYKKMLDHGLIEEETK